MFIINIAPRWGARIDRPSGCANKTHFRQTHGRTNYLVATHKAKQVE